MNPPPRMPEMQWEDFTDHEGNLGRQYVAIGPLLPLEQWHDHFLRDAEEYAREKAERDLRNANEALSAGRPHQAKQLASHIVSESMGRPVYFNLPQDVRQKVEQFLNSPELETSFNRLTNARQLLRQADQLTTGDSQEAWKTYCRALSEPVDVSEQANLIRKRLLPTVEKRLERQIRDDRDDLAAEPSLATERAQKAKGWLDLLPDYERDEEFAQKLDPEGFLKKVLQKVQKHHRFCQLLNELSILEGKAHRAPTNELSKYQTNLEKLSLKIEVAGYEPSDFRLYQELKTWLHNEQNVQETIQNKLTDKALFPDDVAQTDIERLQNELTAARRSRHPEFSRLVGALEARSALYQEVTNSALTLDSREYLLTAVTSNKYALAKDETLAQMRLKRVRHIRETTKEYRERIARVKAYANSATIEGFENAWAELQKLLDNAGELIGEVIAAQQEVRQKVEKRARRQKAIYNRIQNDNEVKTIQKWIALSKDVGAGNVARELEQHFNPRIWRWTVLRLGAEPWQRLEALFNLAQAEPNASENWLEQATSAALRWLIDQLEEIRRTARGKTSLTFQRPEQLLVKLPPFMQNELSSDGIYLRKVAETYIWLDDLQNAEYVAKQAKSATDRIDVGRLNSITTLELDNLLLLADSRQRIGQWLADKAYPSRDDTRQLRNIYNHFSELN